MTGTTMRARGARLGLVALLVVLATQAVVNGRRAAHGLRPLRFDRCIGRIAER